MTSLFGLHLLRDFILVYGLLGLVYQSSSSQVGVCVNIFADQTKLKNVYYESTATQNAYKLGLGNKSIHYHYRVIAN